MPQSFDKKDFAEELVQLSRLAIAGKTQDAALYIRRLVKKFAKEYPEFTQALELQLSTFAGQESSFRSFADDAVVPRDADSRLHLIRTESPETIDIQPIWEPGVFALLDQIVQERKKSNLLASEGMLATRSVLFTGPPGVGKSLAAKWIAKALNKPLITLDLSAVMSSFLGKTGANLRFVLDYAKQVDCVLFLDELDAVAKRRDDATEIGELKRLVTVLLQEVDEWPATGLMLAATNHSDLLDPAVWRRFEMIVPFPLPSDDSVRKAISVALDGRIEQPSLLEVLALIYSGHSLSELNRDVRRLIRQSIMSKVSIAEVIKDLVRLRVGELPVGKRKVLAGCLLSAGFTQRETHDWTRVHRDVLRRMTSEETQGVQ